MIKLTREELVEMLTGSDDNEVKINLRGLVKLFQLVIKDLNDLELKTRRK